MFYLIRNNKVVQRSKDRRTLEFVLFQRKLAKQSNWGFKISTTAPKSTKSYSLLSYSDPVEEQL
jgi:hypothetical protein